MEEPIDENPAEHSVDKTSCDGRHLPHPHRPVPLGAEPRECPRAQHGGARTDRGTTGRGLSQFHQLDWQRDRARGSGGCGRGGHRELDHRPRSRALADSGDGVLGGVRRHAAPGVLGHERNWRRHIKSKAGEESSRAERQAVWNLIRFDPGCLSQTRAEVSVYVL